MKADRTAEGGPERCSRRETTMSASGSRRSLCIYIYIYIYISLYISLSLYIYMYIHHCITNIFIIHIIMMLATSGCLSVRERGLEKVASCTGVLLFSYGFHVFCLCICLFGTLFRSPLAIESTGATPFHLGKAGTHGRGH